MLHDFTEFEGFPERHGLILGSDGLLYGTAYQPLTYGVAFSISTDGDWTLLHTFDGTNGQSPEGGLVEAEDGRFYGTTLGGGQLNLGNFYSVDASGDFESHRVVHADSIADPGALIQGSDGNFLRRQRPGRVPARGHRLPTRTSAGGLDILHEFDGATGRSPAAGVIEASDGYLYGATEFGGPADYGVVYTSRPWATSSFSRVRDGWRNGSAVCARRVARGNPHRDDRRWRSQWRRNRVFVGHVQGQVTYLHDFAGAVDGSYPAQGVFAANDGFFYGVTMADGAEGYGAFYRMDSTGSVTVLRDFTEAEGGAPFQIAPGAGGVFYGSNRTAVVKLDSSGTLTPVHDLPGAGYALDRVVQGTDGDLYGSTFHGGATGKFGMVYRATHGWQHFLRALHDFTGIEGAFPVGRLLETSDGKFYGSTQRGRTPRVRNAVPNRSVGPVRGSLLLRQRGGCAVRYDADRGLRRLSVRRYSRRRLFLARRDFPDGQERG